MTNKLIKLPKLITEDYKIEWLAYLEDTAIICSGKTEEEAIDNLMISIKVMLLYNRE